MRHLTAGALLLTSGVCNAAPVVHADNEVPPPGLGEPIRWADLPLAPELSVVGADTDRPCPTTVAAAPADVDAAIAQAVGALNYLELDNAIAAIAEAEVRTSCLGEPIRQAVLASVAYLDGVGHALAGQPELASEHFAAALAIDPAMQWEPARSPKQGRDLFEEARTRSATEPLGAMRIVPADAVVHVDGVARTGRFELPPGRHLLQDGSDTAWVEVAPAAEIAVVVPAALRADGTAWVHAPESRADLSAVLHAVFGPGLDVRVHVDGETWATRTGGGTWSLVPVDVLASPTGGGGARIGAITGGAVATAGLGVILLAGSQMASARAACTTAKQSEPGTGSDNVCADREASYLAARGLLPIGAVVTGVGAATVGLSLALSSGPAPGVAVQVGWTR